MNTPCIGPRLCMAPEASPGDGRLDLVLLTERERARFEQHLERRLSGEAEALNLPVRSGRRVEIRWDGSPIHVDGDIYADGSLSGDEARADNDAIIDIWLESDVEVLVGTR
jgi:diacylglycerol kinase (ATP)